MKMFDLFVVLLKAEIQNFRFENSSRNLFDVREMLLSGALMKENAGISEKLNEFFKKITPYCCYYAEIEEYLDSERSLKAEEIKNDLAIWGTDISNHDVHKLKAFIESKLEQRESAFLTFLCDSPVDDLSINLRNILDEIPSKQYVTRGEEIFSDIEKLLNRQQHEDSCWDDNIETIKINFNLRVLRKLPWVKIKQALRSDCEELLTPSVFSVYSSPQIKEEFEKLIEGISSERFSALMKLSSVATVSFIKREPKGLYLSERPNNTVTYRQGAMQVTQPESSNLSKFCFG